MNAEEYFSGLKKFHETFLNSGYFSVYSIVTPPWEWVCVDKKKDDPIEKSKEAARREIFNLVVKDNDEVLGYINRKDLEEKKWNRVVKADKFSVPSTYSLKELVGRMVNDSNGINRERSPLYFVHDPSEGSKEWVGVVSFWDMNRAPAYMLSYIGLIYLEHTISLKILESHREWFDHSDLLSSEDITEHIREFLSCGEYHYKSLSEWGIEDLLIFYETDTHIKKDSKLVPEELIKAFKDPDFGYYRNKIGHPVKLLVRDDKDFKKDLRRLEIAWCLGTSVFVNFGNPKMRRTSPLPTVKMF